jgi:hypothetical protein
MSRYTVDSGLTGVARACGSVMRFGPPDYVMKRRACVRLALVGVADVQWPTLSLIAVIAFIARSPVPKAFNASNGRRPVKRQS